jgi:ABC-type multidrug transport system fused ATPase/permease subunit
MMIMQKWTSTIIFSYWKMLTIIVILQIFYALLSVLQPVYYQQIISLAIAGDPAVLMKKGITLVLLLVVIYLGNASLQAASGYFGCIFSSNLLEQLQAEFFDKTSQLPLEYFQKTPSGEMFTKFNNDVGQAQRFFSHSIPTLIRETIISVVIIVVLIFFCPALLILITFCIVLVTAMLVVVLNEIMARYAVIQRNEWGHINKVFDETLAGIDTFKMFTDETRRKTMFQERTTSFRNLSVKAGRLVAIFSPCIDLMSKIGSLFLVLIAYWIIIHKNFGIDNFLLFFFYSVLLQGSIANIATVISGIQPELTGVRNLSDFLLHLKPEDNPKNTKSRLNDAVAINIKCLTFVYPGNMPLYQDAEIYIPAKAVTVLRGPSGSGKSTLINILLRFCQPKTSLILMGNTNIKRFSTEALRKGIGVLTQHHFIFNDSLRENLLIANPEATDAQLLQAIDMAQLSDLFGRMNRGLDEILDPAGRGLSAGEKQRICIARLMVKRAPIMILDEPWSNIDLESREKLVRVINTCRATSTILILTHDIHPSLVVDQHYILDPHTRNIITAKVSSNAFQVESLSLNPIKQKG